MSRLAVFLLVIVFPFFTLSGQDHYTLELKNQSLRKVYLEKTPDGTTFAGVKNFSDTHAEFHIFDASGAKVNVVSVATDGEIIGTYNQDAAITIYSISGKRDIQLKATTLTKSGHTTTTMLLQLSEKAEELVTFCEVDGKPGLVTINGEEQLNVHVFSGEKVLKSYRFPVKHKEFAKRLRKGVSFFSGAEFIPELQSARAEAKAFYENQALYFVLDVPVNDSPATHVLICNLASNTSSSQIYNMRLEGFLNSRSYIHNGFLYRYFYKRKLVQVNIFAMDSKEQIGSLSLDKNSTFPTGKPLFVNKQYAKNRISMAPVSDYKSCSRALTTGHETFFVLPLKNGGIQVTLGAYYKNNNGIAPASLGPLGLLLYAATTTTKALMNDENGAENYLSLNFDNERLGSFSEGNVKSTINRLDEVYKKIVQEHQKLSFFDYCLLNGTYYAAFIPGAKNQYYDDLMPPPKGDAILHLVPFAYYEDND